MKLIIQIPCWNEESTIAEAIRALPRAIAGVDHVEVVVIDDGSSDRTIEEARKAGADHIVALKTHRGLAHAFSMGVETAIRRGADLLVNTDADMQYPADLIPRLLHPLLNGDADLTVGDRLSVLPPPFPPLKMSLERLGTRLVRSLARVPIDDAASGFRAFSRGALEIMFLHGRFSYTLESLVLAGMRGLRIANVPVTVNEPRRKSRLYKTVSEYMVRSALHLVRAYLMYHPLRFFVVAGSAMLACAFGLGIRYLCFMAIGQGGGHLQSLILLSILAFMGFQCFALGLIGDIVAANRRLIEDVRRELVRRGNSRPEEPAQSEMECAQQPVRDHPISSIAMSG